MPSPALQYLIIWPMEFSYWIFITAVCTECQSEVTVNETELYLHVDTDGMGTLQQAIIQALAHEVIDQYNCAMYVLM